MSDQQAHTQPPTETSLSAGQMARLALNWGVAGLSISLVIGFIYWAIDVGTRDPGEVPIIRAMEGPARVLPDDPGGEQAQHQGLAVNRVQADGTVEPPAAQVTLAPEPATLSDEDQTAGTLSQTPPTQPAVQPVQTGTAPATPDVVANDTPVVTQPATVVDDTPDIVTTDDTTLDEPPTQVARLDPAMVPNPRLRGTPLSPSASLRPRGRPGDLSIPVVAVQQTTTVPTPTPSPVANATDVPVGTRLIQLGAYDSEALAQSEWDRLMGKHADLLGDKQRLVLVAESGGRRFFRLRAVGFANLDESRALCSALLARGTPCIPVTAR